MSTRGEVANAPASVLRRLGAVLYDALLVIAVLAAATVPFVPFIGNRVLVPQEVGALAYLYWAWELIVIFLFMGYFWTRRGQTIGMLAWRLQIQTDRGTALSWNDAARRLTCVAMLWAPALIGYSAVWGQWSATAIRSVLIAASLAPVVLSYVWIVIDPQGRAWHDRWSGTRIVRSG